jgi:hypothetical protein
MGGYGVKIVPTLLGRWTIVSAEFPELAWSGSRWVLTRSDMSQALELLSFETADEAGDYAAQRWNRITIEETQ